MQDIFCPKTPSFDTWHQAGAPLPLGTTYTSFGTNTGSIHLHQKKQPTQQSIQLKFNKSINAKPLPFTYLAHCHIAQIGSPDHAIARADRQGWAERSLPRNRGQVAAMQPISNPRPG